MEILTILKWSKIHWKIASKAILSLSVAFCVIYGTILYKENKKLSERLELAQNNIQAYQGALSGSQQACNVLKLEAKDLANQNDKLLNRIDSLRKEIKIKNKEIKTAATQTQIVYVNGGKGVEEGIINKDTTYTDSIKYNTETTAIYTLMKDSIDIQLDIRNTQYLYTYKKKTYKNKKSFIKRLFTLDFKKQTQYKYEIINTNDLIKTSDVRVVEFNNQ